MGFLLAQLGSPVSQSHFPKLEFWKKDAVKTQSMSSTLLSSSYHDPQQDSLDI